MEAKALLTIPEFKGMSTNAPKGTVLAPELLQNVHLDRQGGYTPMPARSRRVAGVTRAVYAARADNLFLEQSGAVNYWDPQAGTFTPVSGVTSLANAVTVMPNVILAESGQTWVTTKRVQSAAFAPGTVSDSGTPTLRWAYEDKSSATSLPYMDAAYEYTIIIEWIPTKAYPLSGITTFQVGAGHGTPPAKFWVSLTSTVPSAEVPHYNVYIGQGRPPLYTGSNYVTIVGPSSNLQQFQEAINITGPGGAKQQPLPDIHLLFNTPAGTAATYHQGRAFLAPASVSYYKLHLTYLDWQQYGNTTLEVEAEPRRLYFSEVTANGTEVLPQFSLLNYIDVPFKVSRRIVALASVGPYLYIFGDRELLVMTGDPSTDARVENIGDSIGAISPGSVQQLSGTVFWQSDSGVLAVQGAQVREVGAEVRDLLLALGLNVTTTVDFRRETYSITDGVTMLCYHVREQGWTVRAVEGSGTPSLLNGGGTPYLLQGTTLYSIGGENGLDGYPPRLQMRVRWPRYELGDWLHRKTFTGVACGMDLATSSATVTNLTTVDASTQLDSATVVAVSPANRGVRLHTVDETGTDLTGVTIGVELLVDTQDSRGILRPPLVVYGALNGADDWSDDRGN